jgi:hypothetical protein
MLVFGIYKLNLSFNDQIIPRPQRYSCFFSPRVILTHAPMCNRVSDRITTDNDTNGNPLAAAAAASLECTIWQLCDNTINRCMCRLVQWCTNCRPQTSAVSTPQSYDVDWHLARVPQRDLSEVARCHALTRCCSICSEELLFFFSASPQ